jgi:hypothetical protein
MLPVLVTMLKWMTGIFGKDPSIGNMSPPFTIMLLWSLIRLMYKYATEPRMAWTAVL